MVELHWEGHKRVWGLVMIPKRELPRAVKVSHESGLVPLDVHKKPPTVAIVLGSPPGEVRSSSRRSRPFFFWRVSGPIVAEPNPFRQGLEQVSVQ